MRAIEMAMVMMMMMMIKPQLKCVADIFFPFVSIENLWYDGG